MALFAEGLFASGLFAVGLFAADSAPDAIPDAYSFFSLGNQAQSTLIESNLVTLVGFDETADVTFSESGHTTGQYSKNGGAWADLAPTTVDSGDTLRLRLTTSASYSTGFSITTDISGVRSTWTLTTLSDPLAVKPRLIRSSSENPPQELISSLV